MRTLVMRCGPYGRSGGSRRGVAAAELALLLPFLSFLFVVSVDFARVFYYYIIVTNCARTGAAYGCIDTTHAADTAGIQTAALTDASSISPTPTVSSTTDDDSAGNPYVRVTVTYAFHTITNFPGIPSSASIQRTVQMRVLP